MWSVYLKLALKIFYSIQSFYTVAVPYCIQILSWIIWVCKEGEKIFLFPRSFSSRKVSVVCVECPEIEAQMWKVFQPKKYSRESTQNEDVRGFGFYLRLFFDSLGLSSHCFLFICL